MCTLLPYGTIVEVQSEVIFRYGIQSFRRDGIDGGAVDKHSAYITCIHNYVTIKILNMRNNDMMT